MTEKFSEDDLHELMGDEQGLNSSSSPHPIDPYESTEIQGDFSFLNSGEWEQETDFQEVDCECLLGNSILCTECFHDLRCADSDCSADRHLKSLKFGLPNECDCFNDSSADPCTRCGHHPTCPIPTASCTKSSHSESTTLSESDSLKRVVEKLTDNEAPTSNAGKYWTAEEDERLIRAYSASRSFGEIAIEHGRTERSIWMRLVHLSFQSEPDVSIVVKSKKFELSTWQAGQIEVLTSSYTAGVSPATLAEVLNLNIVDVARKIVELGMANPKILPAYRQVKNFRRWTTVELTQLREDFRNKLPIDLMAENAGRSKFSVLSTLYSIGEIGDKEVNELIQDASSAAYGD